MLPGTALPRLEVNTQAQAVVPACRHQIPSPDRPSKWGPCRSRGLGTKGVGKGWQQEGEEMAKRE